MDLGNILDEIKATKPSKVQDEPGYGPFGVLDNHNKWSVEDKLPSLQLELSRYEAHWLWWRLKVHLKSYESMEWSEMKEVLECLMKRISSLSITKI